jgi:hypothetical protein
MQDKRKVQYKEGLALGIYHAYKNKAQKYGLKYIETSAKSSINIDTSFQSLSKEIITRLGSNILQYTKIKIFVLNRKS